MKKYLLLIFLISLVFTSCNLEAVTPKKADLMTAIHEFNSAFQQGDIETIESMISKDYKHTNGTSKVIGREQWLNYLKKRTEKLTSGELKVLKYSMDDLEVQLFERSALVTGKIEVQIQSNDSIENHAYRVTHLWRIEDGKWKRAGFHDGKIY